MLNVIWKVLKIWWYKNILQVARLFSEVEGVDKLEDEVAEEINLQRNQGEGGLNISRKTMVRRQAARTGRSGYSNSTGRK